MDIFPSFKKIIQKNDTFILWILLVLSIDYLALFFMESILPGYVMPYINLNFLLLFLLIGWLVYAVSVDFKKNNNSFNFLIKKTFQIFLVIIFILGTWFTLYKLAAWEILLSFIFLSVIGWLFYEILID